MRFEYRSKSIWCQDFEHNGREMYHMPDHISLALDIEDACNDMGRDGFEVVSITPLLKGECSEPTGTLDLSLWFSRTQGVIVTAKRKIVTE